MPTPIATATPTTSEIVNDLLPNIVQVVSSSASGTGFVYHESGRILTAAHVIGDNQGSLSIILQDGTEHDATVVGIDEIKDIAIIQFQSASEFQFVNLGDSDSVSIGDDIVVVGFSAGSIDYDIPTITSGILSAKGSWEGIEILQTDAPLNPGVSGGPLLSSDGQVVGIALSNIREEDGRRIEGAGFAIAINDVKDSLEFLENGGIVNLPSSWPTHESSYGYSIGLAPGWNLSWEYDATGSAWFETDDSYGEMRIFVFDFGGLSTWNDARRKGWIDLFGPEYLVEEKTEEAQDESYPLFEIIQSDPKNRNFSGVLFRRQTTRDRCIENGAAKNMIHPDYPLLYSIEGYICEGDSARFSDLVDMIESFTFLDVDYEYITTIPSETYRSELGYSITLVSRWEEDDSSTYGSEYVVFHTELGSVTASRIQIQSIDLTEINAQPRDFNREFFFGANQRRAQERGYHKFEFVQRVSVGRHYGVIWKEQRTPNSCVSHHVGIYPVHPDYPRNTYGFAVEGWFCESEYEEFNPQILAILRSFTFH